MACGTHCSDRMDFAVSAIKRDLADISDYEELEVPGEADEELVSGGEGGILVHGTLLLNTRNRAILFSPTLDLKAGHKDHFARTESRFMYVIPSGCYGECRRLFLSNL